jgi:hypothetical protein
MARIVLGRGLRGRDQCADAVEARKPDPPDASVLAPLIEPGGDELVFLAADPLTGRTGRSAERFARILGQGIPR